MNVLSFKKIKRASVMQQVYDSIKERILEGELPPGTHLFETTIAEQTGTSRGPIREALRQLEADGLVEARANVGTFVRKLTVEEIKEIYTVRSLLEGYAAELAAEKATRLDVEKLRRIMQAANKSARKGDLRDTVRLDFDLHRQIWEMSAHHILYNLLHQLEGRVRMFITLQAPLFAQLVDSIQDHATIVDAIAEGNGEKASDLIREHIMQAGLLLIRHIDGNEERGLKEMWPSERLGNAIALIKPPRSGEIHD